MEIIKRNTIEKSCFLCSIHNLSQKAFYLQKQINLHHRSILKYFIVKAQLDKQRRIYSKSNFPKIFPGNHMVHFTPKEKHKQFHAEQYDAQQIQIVKKPKTISLKIQS